MNCHNSLVVFLYDNYTTYLDKNIEVLLIKNNIRLVLFLAHISDLFQLLYIVIYLMCLNGNTGYHDQIIKELSSLANYNIDKGIKMSNRFKYESCEDSEG
jgi:hypothetical protein